MAPEGAIYHFELYIFPLSLILSCSLLCLIPSPYSYAYPTTPLSPSPECSITRYISEPESNTYSLAHMYCIVTRLAAKDLLWLIHIKGPLTCLNYCWYVVEHEKLRHLIPILVWPRTRWEGTGSQKIVNSSAYVILPVLWLNYRSGLVT